MMKKSLIPLLTALLGFGMISCNNSGGDPTPVIDTEKKVTVKGKATYGSSAIGGRIANEVSLDRFLVNIEEIELKIDDADERSATDSVQTEPEFAGPFILDLLADTLAVDLAGAEIPVGIYDQIEFKLTPSRDASSDLHEKSALIEGSIGGVPFVFWTDAREEFEINFTRNGGDLIVDNSGFVVVIDFNLDALFGANGVDISQAQDGNGDGVIEIYPDDPDGNNVLAVKILSALEDAVELEEDEDLDEDGEGNSEDDDIDGDGIDNDEDEDDDNDGVGDDDDNDDDGDGHDDEEDDGEDHNDDNSDDDGEDEQEASAINATLMAGDWTVELFSKVNSDGADTVMLADEFAGFLFGFDAHEMFRAENNDTQEVVEGEWETITNLDTPILLIEVEVEVGPFEFLEDDWEIVSISDSRIELVSSSDHGYKLLVLEQ